MVGDDRPNVAEGEKPGGHPKERESEKVTGVVKGGSKGDPKGHWLPGTLPVANRPNSGSRDILGPYLSPVSLASPVSHPHLPTVWDPEKATTWIFF